MTLAQSISLFPSYFESCKSIKYYKKKQEKKKKVKKLIHLFHCIEKNQEECKLKNMIQEKYDEAMDYFSKGNIKKTTKILRDYCIAYQTTCPDLRGETLYLLASELQTRNYKLREANSKDKQKILKTAYLIYQEKNKKLKNKTINKLEKKEFDKLCNFYITFNQKKALEHLWTLINIIHDDIGISIFANSHKMAGEIYEEKAKVHKEKNKEYKRISFNHMKKAKKILENYIKKEKKVDIDIIEDFMDITFRLSGELLDKYYKLFDPFNELNKKKKKESNKKNKKYLEKCFKYLNQIISHGKNKTSGKALFYSISAMLNKACLYRQEYFGKKYQEALEVYNRAFVLTKNNMTSIDETKGKGTANKIIEQLYNSIYTTQKCIESDKEIVMELKPVFLCSEKKCE